jgi:hypothetical protein
MFARFLRLSALLVLGIPAAIACSSANDDPVGLACTVIVDQCHATRSMSDCIDGIVGLPPDCIDCIGQSGCDYPSCQRVPSGCRIPLDLISR